MESTSELYTIEDYHRFVEGFKKPLITTEMEVFHWAYPELDDPSRVMFEVKIKPEEITGSTVTAAQTLYFVSKSFYDAQEKNVVGNTFQFAGVLHVRHPKDVYADAENARFLRELFHWGYLVIPLWAMKRKKTLSRNYEMKTIGLSRPYSLGISIKETSLRDLIVFGRPVNVNSRWTASEKTTHLIEAFYETLLVEGENNNAHC